MDRTASNYKSMPSFGSLTRQFSVEDRRAASEGGQNDGVGETKKITCPSVG
jgi:hypothetical protein